MILKNITNIKEITKVSTALSEFYTTFDAVNEYVNIGNKATLSFIDSTPFTLSVWVTSADWTTFTFLLGKQSPFGTFPGYVLRTLGGMASVGIIDNAGTQIRCQSSILTNNILYCVTASYDGSGTVGGLNMYVDGALDINITAGTTISTMSNSSYDFNIGASHTGTLTWNGTQDEIAVFNRELTAIEILDIYNRGRMDVDYSDIPNLVSHWRMDTLNPVDETGTNNGTSINMDATNIIKYAP